jgi:hypothetical protein
MSIITSVSFVFSTSSLSLNIATLLFAVVLDVITTSPNAYAKSSAATAGSHDESTVGIVCRNIENVDFESFCGT